ncbi:putative disease resistance protein (TIR-NBS-LRR class), partial [Trifolium medium]|nr:putative disease resistance protein (TIR-NBS-LRR class) [Trifolium medium]
LFTDKVAIDLQVLGALVENGIGCYIYNIHWSSQVAAARARYSASDEERETVNCFFVLQDMRDFPRKKHWPEMDLLVSTQPAQSASENPKM